MVPGTKATSWPCFIPAPTGPTNGGAANLAPPPIPSIRLKAYRRGQQDVEYLVLWSSLHNQPRWAVGRQARAAFKLTGTRQGTGTAAIEDAGRIDYTQLRPGDLWAMRTAIAGHSPRPTPHPGKSSSTFAPHDETPIACRRRMWGLAITDEQNAWCVTTRTSPLLKSLESIGPR